MVGFAPSYLGAAGLGAAEIGLLTGAATWLVVASAQAGGMLAQRWGRPGPLLDHRRARLGGLPGRRWPPDWCRRAWR